MYNVKCTGDISPPLYILVNGSLGPWGLEKSYKNVEKSLIN